MQVDRNRVMIRPRLHADLLVVGDGLVVELAEGLCAELIVELGTRFTAQLYMELAVAGRARRIGV